MSEVVLAKAAVSLVLAGLAALWQWAGRLLDPMGAPATFQ